MAPLSNPKQSKNPKRISYDSYQSRNQEFARKSARLGMQSERKEEINLRRNVAEGILLGLDRLQELTLMLSTLQQPPCNLGNASLTASVPQITSIFKT